MKTQRYGLISTARRSFLKTIAPIAILSYPGSRAKSESNSQQLYPAVRKNRTLTFPRDHGAHPDYRTEWWYLTAWLESEQGPLGLQITFFRSRTPYGRDNPSRFAPTQLLLAHAALAIPSRGRLLHDQQAWRVDGSVAQFSTSNTDLVLGMPTQRWHMTRDQSDQYRAEVVAKEFSFSITATPSAKFNAPLLQGDRGFSRKGPAIEQASYYYSRPQLQISGDIQTDGAALPVKGTGWLDHEWSSELLDKNAAGWDWVGLNFVDGSALMAFRMRGRAGDVLYSSAKYVDDKSGNGEEMQLSPTFIPLRYWQSPRTNARYPVAMQVKVGPLDLMIEPLLDDQELDSRGSTGVIYWEGAIRVWDNSTVDEDGFTSHQHVATGYMELTGYAGDIVM